MPRNKSATIRYHALDECFANPYRKYYIDDLVEACNTAIYENTGKQEGVKKRQVYEDIKFMESEEGWGIELEKHKENRRTYYRYKNKDFSIRSKGLSAKETEQIADALSILRKFNGLPQFDWLNELEIRLEPLLKNVNNEEVHIYFDQNPYLKGLEFFQIIYEAIRQKYVLSIRYQGFKQKDPVIQTFHPWLLKQYNKRWFLFGWNDHVNRVSNLALDRVLNIEVISGDYRPNVDFDFEEYFEDIIGVSNDPQREVEEVILSVDRSVWPYIESKPLHGSQRILGEDEDSILLQLKIKLNHEFKALLFSYMDGIVVLEPPSLVEEIKSTIQRMSQNISDVCR